MPQYDILISNPPYIRSAEIENLMEEVRDHDPRLALDGHEDGLYFYRKIVSEGRAFLKEKCRGPRKRWSSPTRLWRAQKAPMQLLLL